MAYTQADLAALQAAIAKGARSVRMDGEEVTFRTLDEMERIEAKIMREVGQPRRKRIVQAGSVSQWR